MDDVLICPNCKAKLKVNPASLKFVKEIRCRKCGEKFPIPGKKKSSPAAAVNDKEATVPAPLEKTKHKEPISTLQPSAEISFSCPKCGRKLTVQKSMTGEKVKCKQCGTITTVPQADGNLLKIESLQGQTDTMERQIQEMQDRLQKTEYQMANLKTRICAHYTEEIEAAKKKIAE